MTDAIHFDQVRLPDSAQALRREVRGFLADEIAAGTFDPRRGATVGAFHPEFSRKVGARGWIGMTWPRRYGGGERSFLDRYVVTEEFRVANAPVGLHFTADRQSGPILLRYASERIKADILPRITRGECCFCIGMSEPGSGLGSVRRPDPRDPVRRRLAGDRHQGVDHRGAPRRLHDRPVPDLAAHARGPPARPDPVPGRPAHARHRRSARSAT